MRVCQSISNFTYQLILLNSFNSSSIIKSPTPIITETKERENDKNSKPKNSKNSKFFEKNQIIKNFGIYPNIINIAGRLPENSRNSFVNLQSQKKAKKRPKKFVFSLKAEMLNFD